MQFGGAYTALMRGGNKDCVTRMPSLANEEPLEVVQACYAQALSVVGVRSLHDAPRTTSKSVSPACHAAKWARGRERGASQ